MNLEEKFIFVTPFSWQCKCIFILPPGFEPTLSKTV